MIQKSSVFYLTKLHKYKALRWQLQLVDQKPQTYNQRSERKHSLPATDTITPTLQKGLPARQLTGETPA